MTMSYYNKPRAALYNTDILSGIIPYLTLKEFVRFLLLTNKRLRKQVELILRITKQHLINKWNINEKLYKHFLSDIDDVNHLYYMISQLPYVMPIIDKLSTTTTTTTTNNLIINDLNAIFIGNIGQSNRSITTTQSFPTANNLYITFSNEFEKLILTRNFKKVMILCKEMYEAKKIEFRHIPLFSIPYQCKSYTIANTGTAKKGYNSNHSMTVISSVTPRSVAYYEILITPAPITSPSSTTFIPPSFNHIDDNTTTTTNNTTNSNTNTSSSVECIAIGLATNEFRSQEKLPGWDYSSYGYHGDDGGLFHGNGRLAYT